MYKTISISNSTYQKLHAIATRLDKPKAQVIDDLVREHSESMKGKERKELEKFNREMGAKIKTLRFSKKITVDTTNTDADFSTLADTDYLR